jgi:hypothetical protein
MADSRGMRRMRTRIGFTVPRALWTPSHKISVGESLDSHRIDLRGSFAAGADISFGRVQLTLLGVRWHRLRRDVHLSLESRHSLCVGHMTRLNPRFTKWFQIIDL